MRWTHVKRPRKGDTRRRRVFLWWPLKLGREIRWFEMATVEERVNRSRAWVSDRFIDEETGA